MADTNDGFWARRNVILADITGFSAMIRYDDGAKQPVWRDFGSPRPPSAIDNSEARS